MNMTPNAAENDEQPTAALVPDYVQHAAMFTQPAVPADLKGWVFSWSKGADRSKAKFCVKVCAH